MKKRKLRYSELAPSAATTPAPAPTPAVPPPEAPAEPHVARLVTPMRGMPRITPLRGVPAVAGARSLRDRVRGRTGLVELLLFRVANERFGIDLASVEEAIDLPPVHHVPEMPPSMLGVITVRGTLTPVYSPQAALGLALTDGTSALVFKRGKVRFALVIDDVADVTTLDLALLRPAPGAPGIDGADGVVLGVLRQRDDLVAVVDTDTLLATCQAVPLLETA